MARSTLAVRAIFVPAGEQEQPRGEVHGVASAKATRVLPILCYTSSVSSRPKS